MVPFALHTLTVHLVDKIRKCTHIRKLNAANGNLIALLY